MDYARKLLIAKIFITVALLIFVFGPFFSVYGEGHMQSDFWSAHAKYHLQSVRLANVLALPILLYVLWGKLHGTGRSVRLVAFLGMAFTCGYFLADIFSSELGISSAEPGHNFVLFGQNGNFVINVGIFAGFAIGVLLSIRRKN